MKTKTNKIKTLFLVAVSCLLSLSSKAQQIEFKQDALVFIQSIAITTSYADLIETLESKKIEIQKTKNKNKTESISFKISQKEFTVLYSRDKKIIYVCTYSNLPLDSKYPGFDILLDDLEKNGFKEHKIPVTSSDVDTFVSSVRHYNKESYPFQFIIKHFNTGPSYIYIYDEKFGSIDKFTTI